MYMRWRPSGRVRPCHAAFFKSGGFASEYSIAEFDNDPNIPSAFTHATRFFEKMEPLSLASSVAGLLGTSAKVLTILRDPHAHAKDAPPSISRVLEGVEELHSTLCQVHAIMLFTAFPEHGRLTATLSGLVLVIHELYRYFGKVADLADASVNMNSIKRTWNRVKWAYWKEREIADFVEQLQRYNVSLKLMLAVVQW
jgi:hypothetical protein